MELDQEELIRRVLESDEEAVRQLVALLQHRIFTLALRMLGNPAEAEDAVQEILLKILSKLPGFRQESSLVTWAMKIAVHDLLDQRESMFSAHPLNFEEYARDIQAYQQESERPEPERQVLGSELKLSCTNVMLQCLTPQDRCIFILGTMFRADSRTAAGLLDMTPENYRQRLSRARRKMADFMSQYCWLASGGCRCTRRIDFAIGTRRLDPDHLEYSRLKPCRAETLQLGKEVMEQLDDLSAAFEPMNGFELPEAAQDRLQSLIHSDMMNTICQLTI